MRPGAADAPRRGTAAFRGGRAAPVASEMKRALTPTASRPFLHVLRAHNTAPLLTSSNPLKDVFKLGWGSDSVSKPAPTPAAAAPKAAPFKRAAAPKAAAVKKVSAAQVGKGYAILNHDDHKNFLRKHKRDPTEYRPDILHQVCARKRPRRAGTSARTCPLARARAPPRPRAAQWFGVGFSIR